MTTASSPKGNIRRGREDEHAYIFAAAKTMAAAIGAMFGADCEVAVHDLRNPTRSLVHLVNGHVSGRQVGHPIRDLIATVLPNLNGEDVLANYATTLADGRVLKATTFLIRDPDAQPLIAVCMNYDVSRVAAMSDVLQQFTTMFDFEGAPSTREPKLEDLEVLDVLQALVLNTARQFSRAPTKLSKEERLEAIDFLETRGAFLIKGSVPMVAKTLGLSEPSVYRYIDLVRGARARDG